MNKSKSRYAWPVFALAVSLFAASFTAFLVNRYNQQIYFHILDDVCETVLEIQPDAEEILSAALKNGQKKSRWDKMEILWYTF